MSSNEYTFTGDTVTLNQWLRSKCQPGLKYTLKLTKYQKKRTLDQSAQSFVWYSQLARELKEDDEQGWRRFCKLHFAIPILRSSDSQFREFYDKAVKPNFSYEDKLKVMDFMPATSLMTTEMFSSYFSAMQEHFKTRGVLLEFLR